MEAQMARAPGHVEDAPQMGLEQNNDQGHGKKSVLKKVKDKAKKIKHTLTPGKHHQGGDDDDDGEDDQEMIENQAHHLPSPTNPPHASIDPTVTESKTREDATDRSLGDVLRTSNMEADPQAPMGAFDQPDPSNYQSKVADPTYDKPSEIDSSVMESKPRSDDFSDASLKDAVLDSNLEEDPHAPMGEFDKPDPGNYQSKVADPTNDNSVEAQMGPLVDELGALKVEETGPTGSHDHFLPDSENTPYNEAEVDATPAPSPASYTEKISAATSAITGSAVSAKDVIANKLGYGSKDQQGDQPVPETGDTESSRDYFLPASDDAGFNEGEKIADAPEQASENTPPASYTEKLSAATSAVTGSAVSAKDAIAEKLGYGKGGDQSVPSETKIDDTHDQFLPASDHIPYNDGVNEVDPAPENPPPASYTEKLSAATSAITGSAVSAKDAIAGKLGYVTNNKEGEQAAPDAAPAGTAPAGTRIKETLAPVYDKVAGMGTAVASKLPGTGGAGEDGSGVNSPSKLSEKLRPGDEDRALSEVISGALSRKKDSEVDPAVSPGERSLAADGGGSPGSGNMVGRIKEAVTSLFSNAGQTTSPKGAATTSPKEAVPEGRSLQESAN